ncbi:hypothetical protein KUCAC02_003370 [Chaenocephalus aceratus]|uniref:Uncharacterized protein n=1 Tax=Chaenocephalus aceratus TaxID=36190 RepID=A0ACB9WM39_CHAAC|nr:hypothetical protein KUCAC02_003370 [Chaenocephalus aceratus]
MCGENHVGLSFIYPVLLNMANNTLSANESDLVAIHDVREEAQARLTQLVREDGEVEQPGATGEEEIADNVGVELAEEQVSKRRDWRVTLKQLFGAHFESSRKRKRVNGVIAG